MVTRNYLFWFKRIGLAFLLVLIIISGWLSYRVYSFLTSPIIPANKTLVYDFAPGTGILQLSYRLQYLGYLPNHNYLIWLAEWRGVIQKLQAGIYEFKGGLTPDQLLQQLVQGQVLQLDFTLVDGWTFNEMMKALNQAPYIKHTVANDTPMQIQAILKIKGTNNPEGLFYPNTYRYVAGSSDVTLLKRMYHTMQKHLTAAWQNRAPNLPYQTPYQALIAASLIEKETGYKPEMPTISGVIVRRLEKGMRLQIDSSVIYGLGTAYHGKLTRQDLRVDTPYNTYRHQGLPPTPIAMPDLSAITAALHPAAGDVLYFVAKGNGQHEFSVTLQQQDAAIRKYLLKQPRTESDRK